MSELVYAPAPREDFVELGRVGSGRIFKKMILPKGREFVNPANPTQKIKVDDDLCDSLEKNFRDHVCDIVQVPICDDKNQHTEDPLRNLGEVIDLQNEEKGLYAIIDARKPQYADELGKTLIGASAMMHLNYADTATGEKKGPTLLHVAVTNRPYLTDLEGYEEVIAASRADYNDEDGPILLTLTEVEDEDELDEDEAPAAETPEEPEMQTKEEMIAALKSEHGIDVAALLAAQAPEVPVALSNALGFENNEITLNDIAAGVVELSNTVKQQGEALTTLTEENEALKLSAAETEIDGLIKAGRILPKQRADMVALSMVNREMFERLLPEDSVVALSEAGVTTHDPRPTGNEEAEVDRYTQIGQSFRTGKKPSPTV